MLPGALARHTQIFVFPWGICPRIPVFKRADFYINSFLETTTAFFFFFPARELIVNCLKISLEKLRGESNVSSWQLYCSSLGAVWPPLFRAGSLGDGGNLRGEPRDLRSQSSSDIEIQSKGKSYTVPMATRRTIFSSSFSTATLTSEIQPYT